MTQLSLTKTIEDLEDRRYAAMLSKDLNMLNALLHKELTYVHSSGDIDTKQSYVTGLGDGTWTYERIQRSHQTIKIYGSLAMVFNRLSISLVARGKPKELDNVALAVWTNEGGQWKLIAVQSGVRPTS